MHPKRSLYLLAPFIVALVGSHLSAQSKAQSGTLFQTIEAMDLKLFGAYNRCDLRTLSEMVSADLEFYHDQSGLSVGKDSFLAAINQNICGKVERTLVRGSMEVYPLKGYGAVQIGVHRFHQPKKPEEGVGEAKFVTVWRNENGVWQVTRAISYAHESAK
jgi:hypothetical protein